MRWSVGLSAWWRYIPAVEAGLKIAMENGVYSWLSVTVGVEAKLYDGSYHDVN